MYQQYTDESFETHHNDVAGGSVTQVAESVAIELTDIAKTYETREGEEIRALDRVNVKIPAGEFVSIVGPSGCGKSTLLMMISGLIPLTSGVIRLDDEPVRRPHPNIGVVFQRDLLLEWRRILDNVLLPIEIKRWGRARYVERAKTLLAQVGLAGYESRYPDELSGGMRQRAAICRALVQSPGLLMMDEPFGALDALTREQMNTDLQRLWLTLNNTVVFITHSIDEAVFLSDRVLVMTPRPGRIQLDLTIKLARPRTAAVRSSPAFVGYVEQIRRFFEASGILTTE
jgi:NitT/TauT family transport system ATP-binding protein